MVRLVLGLLSLSGCGLVLGLERVSVPESVCGPFGSVRPLTIDGVTEPRMFSTDGTLGLVFGRPAGGALRPVVLQSAGADTWEPHPTLQSGLDSIPAIAGAHLAPPELTPNATDYTGSPAQPVMMVWSGTPTQLSRYYFSGTTWTFDTNMTPVTDNAYDVSAGNVVVVKGNGGVDDIVRHTVQVKHALDPTMDPDQILLSANTPPTFNLSTRPDRTRPLNEARLELGQAVISSDLGVLVYSAKVGTSWDLFETSRTEANDFETGGGVGADVNTAADEVEPWIDDDCSRMYFRRLAAGQSNNAGTIFVAE